MITIHGTQAQFNTLADRGSWVDICRQFVNVVAGKWYIVSSYVGGFHCAGQIIVEKYNGDENQYQGIVAETPIAGQIDVHNKPNNFIDAISGEFAKGLGENAKRIFVKFKAPDTGKILLVFRINRYAKNQTYGDFYLARPMLEECTEYTTQPSPWQNAGVTAIHGGSIVTKSITTQQMAANSITANEIAAGAVAAKHIAANSIGANHIATRSLTSDKLNVSSLSAISSDIGRINAGDITGVNIHGNNINGNNISGGTITGATVNATDINGGTIRGARLEGVTGKFTGTLEVNQLVGGNLFETFIATAYKVGGNYQSHIKINPSPVKRIFFLLNSRISFVVEANNSYTYNYWSALTNSSELFDFGDGRTAKICINAYALSDTRTMFQQ